MNTSYHATLSSLMAAGSSSAYLGDDKELNSSTISSNPVYEHTIESRTWRIAKQVLSYIIFPIALYNLTHRLFARILLPSLNWVKTDQLDEKRKMISDDFAAGVRFKRIAIKVDGCVLDAYIICKHSTLESRRWALFSIGNNAYAERAADPYYADIAAPLNSNAIVFNYPGVGASTGAVTRSNMIKAYRAVLSFLEDQEKGLGAKEIIAYGRSFGGGVQGEALLEHELKDRIKYVFVKSQTFSSMAAAAKGVIKQVVKLPKPLVAVIAAIAGFAVRIFRWNISSLESSLKLTSPEVVIQSVKPRTTQICDDGVISKKASLAQGLLDRPEEHQGAKTIRGVSCGHNDPFSEDTTAKIVQNINKYLNL